MTEQEQLSIQYSDLKERHQKLKYKAVMRGITNKKLNEQNGKLLQRIKSLEEQLESQRDEVVVKLPKGGANGYYVSYKKYQKVYKLIEEYAQKYGACERMNIQLKEENRKLKGYDTETITTGNKE